MATKKTSAKPLASPTKSAKGVNGKSIIRTIYLYMVTAIAIVLILISSIGLLNLLLKEYVFEIKSWEEMQDFSYQCDPKVMDPIGVQNKTVATKTAEEIESCIAKKQLEASEQAKNRKLEDLTWFISMLVVALPIYLFHWGVIQRDQNAK